MRLPEPYAAFSREYLDLHASSLELSLGRHDGHTCVDRRKAGGHLSVSRPLSDQAPRGFCLINTAGGIVQGDRLALSLRLAGGCGARITTQSANKIYGMDRNCAIQTTAIELDAGSYLEYAPEPNIPYAGSRFFQFNTLRLNRDSTLLYWDVLYPGRYGRGEVFDRCVYFSRLDAFIDGEPALVDTVLIDPERQDPLAAGIMGGRRFYASVYIYADGYERIEKRLKGYSHCVNAAGLLLVRILDDDALSLRRRLEKLHGAFKKAYGP